MSRDKILEISIPHERTHESNLFVWSQRPSCHEMVRHHMLRGMNFTQVRLPCAGFDLYYIENGVQEITMVHPANSDGLTLWFYGGQN